MYPLGQTAPFECPVEERNNEFSLQAPSRKHFIADVGRHTASLRAKSGELTSPTLMGGVGVEPERTLGILIACNDHQICAPMSVREAPLLLE